MNKLTLIALCCAAALFGAEARINLQDAAMSSPAPRLIADPLSDAYEFKADDNGYNALLLNQSFDLSAGARIELEFQDDKLQNNPFPRLLECAGVSLHFEANPNSNGDKVLKVLLNERGNNAVNQIKTACKYREGMWHRVILELDPVNKVVALQLDNNERKDAPIIVNLNLKNVRFMVGATSIKGSTRAFSGRVRNLVITTPYTLKGSAELQRMLNVKETEGVRHITISAIKGRHLAFPGVTRLPSGELAAVFREGEGHVCPFGRICIAYSKDNGVNWSAPVAVADTESDERDPSIQTLPNGEVLLTHGGWNSFLYYKSDAAKYPHECEYIRQSGEKNFGGCFYRFSKDGHHFGEPIKVNAFSPHGPAVAKDGTLYQPSLGNDNGARQIYMFKGSPDAKKWEKIATVCEMKKEDWFGGSSYEEPHTTILADGTMVTAIRIPPPGDGYMRICRSTDGGRTWTAPIKTPVRGYPQHLLPLKDGRLLATYGYRYTPSGVRACISNDGGLTWDIEHEIVIRCDANHDDLGYPVAIEMPNGEVLCVYYMNDKKHNDCFIEGAFFRP